MSFSIVSIIISFLLFNYCNSLERLTNKIIISSDTDLTEQSGEWFLYAEALTDFPAQKHQNNRCISLKVKYEKITPEKNKTHFTFDNKKYEIQSENKNDDRLIEISGLSESGYIFFAFDKIHDVPVLYVGDYKKENNKYEWLSLRMYKFGPNLSEKAAKVLQERIEFEIKLKIFDITTNTGCFPPKITV